MSKQKNNAHDVVTYIGPNTTLNGEIHADYSIHVDGLVSGELICNGDVIIGESCTLTGLITAKNVIVSGRVNGNIHASNGLEIKATGYVEGDIKGSTLSVEEGGVYKGKVNMDIIEAQSVYEGLFQVVKK